jgi:endo-1,4-beta-xylanase
MKRAYLSVLLVLLGVWMTIAASVNITGTVIKTGAGPLKDVTISLAGVSGISTITDAEGKFTLLTPVKTIETNAPKSMTLNFTLNGRDLIFSSGSEKISGNIAVFSGIGRQLVSMDFTDLVPLTQRLTLPSFTPGLNILRITVNNNTFSCPIIQEGKNLYFKESGSTGSKNIKLAKMMADPVDTLIAKKNGYSDKKTPISSYTQSDVAISMDTIVTKVCNATTLKAAGECGSHKILIGAAVNTSGVNSITLSTEFNYLTPDNDMKWQYTEPSNGGFSYTNADKIVSAAKSKGIKVKGHCLVWHNQLPSWVSNSTGKDNVLAIMKRHIETVMGHFGTDVYAWDVVNEAILTDSDEGSGKARMRESVFYKQIGSDYIEQAFKIAREYADSKGWNDMKLYYNDYSIDADNDKSKFAHTMIKGWVDKGVPIDGVGFQMHIGPPNNIPTVQAVKDNMQFYADLGLEVLISEWDINLCGSKVSEADQLKLYHDITKVCVDQPKCTAITWWGINDSESWLNSFSGSLCNGGNSQSLLFMNNGQQKDTYKQVLNALNGK